MPDTLVMSVYNASWEPQNRCPAEWVHDFHPHSIFHFLRHRTLHSFSFHCKYIYITQRMPPKGGLNKTGKITSDALFKPVLILCTSAWVTGAGTARWNAAHQRGCTRPQDEAGCTVRGGGQKRMLMHHPPSPRMDVLFSAKKQPKKQTNAQPTAQFLHQG